MGHVVGVLSPGAKVVSATTGDGISRTSCSRSNVATSAAFWVGSSSTSTGGAKRQPGIGYAQYVAQEFHNEIQSMSWASGSRWLKVWKQALWAVKGVAKKRPGAAAAATSAILMGAFAGGALASSAAWMVLEKSSDADSMGVGANWRGESAVRVDPEDAVAFGGFLTTLALASAAVLGCFTSAIAVAIGSLALMAPADLWDGLHANEEFGVQLVSRSRLHGPTDADDRKEPLLASGKTVDLNAMDEDWTADEAPPSGTRPRPARRRSKSQFAAAALAGKAGTRGKQAVEEVKKATLVWTLSLAKGVRLVVDGQPRELLVKRPVGSIPFRRRRCHRGEEAASGSGSSDPDDLGGTYAAYTDLWIGHRPGDAFVVDSEVRGAEPAEEPPAELPAGPARASPMSLPLLGIGLRLRGKHLDLVYTGSEQTECNCTVELASETEAVEFALALRLLRASADSGAGVWDWGERPADDLKRPPAAE